MFAALPHRARASHPADTDRSLIHGLLIVAAWLESSGSGTAAGLSGAMLGGLQVIGR